MIIAKGIKQMTYLVQIQIANTFRDVYVVAANEKQAVEIARREATSYERRWASFVL